MGAILDGDEQAPQITDAVEIPDQFYSDLKLEDAGDGMIRMVRYIRRGDVLIPSFPTVTPYTSLLRQLDQVIDFVRRYRQERPIRLVNGDDH